MLSRVSLRSLQRPIGALLARASSSSIATARDENGELLYRRPVRAELPGPCRYAFVPEEWFTFFYKKTGVSGPYTFFTTVTTWLVSKEIYVLEHEFYTGCAIVIMCIIFMKKFAPGINDYLQKELDEVEADWNKGRLDEIKYNEDSIVEEKKAQWCADGQMQLIEAKKENVQLQLEAAYRQRLATVYGEVKRRLDYQVESQLVDRRVKQKHLVNWVVGGVLKSITPDQEKENINKCIADLALLAGKAK